MRAFDFLVGRPWAITEAALQHMLQIYEAAVDRKAQGLTLDRAALEAELGRPLDNTHVVTTRGGVAVIPVQGPIFRHADIFTEISGATSLGQLAQDVNVALKDPDIHSLLLHIDSPGGETNGVNEFANMPYAARGVKPLVAYVADLGASAAYWIASACDEIVCDGMAALGSIGVVAAVPDPTKGKGGRIEFVSSQSPNKRPDPLTERGRAEIQRVVDDSAQVFIEAVARNRGVEVETVTSDYGRGGLLVGKHAVAAGLADRLGSFEGVVAELNERQGRAFDTVSSRRGATDAPPTHTEGRMSKPSLFSKEWFANLMAADREVNGGALGAMDAQEAAVPRAQPDAPVQVGADTGAPREAVPGTADSPETARLRQQLATEQARRFAAEAEAFAERQVSAGKAMPAERGALQAAYIRAAQDDAQYGATTPSRVETLAAVVDARPKHGLTEELVAATSDISTGLLTNKTSSDADDVSAAADGARKYAERMNGHPAGKGH